MIVLTANQDVNLAITAINYGAIDYIVKGENDIFRDLLIFKIISLVTS